MADHKHKMSRQERHILGFDHAANKAHGDTISSATVTLVDDYNGASVSSSILSEPSLSGLKASVLVGDFPKNGKYRLTFLCEIGAQRFEDDLVISVED